MCVCAVVCADFGLKPFRPVSSASMSVFPYLETTFVDTEHVTQQPGLAPASSDCRLAFLRGEKERERERRGGGGRAPW